MAKQIKSKKLTKAKKIGVNKITETRKNFTIFVVVSMFMIGGLAFGASSFAASNTPKRLKICNYGVYGKNKDIKSNAAIAIYYNDARYNYKEIAPGKCRTYKNWNVRVDVDAHEWDHTHSYRLGKITTGGGVNWGTCHKDSANPKSNPPNKSPLGVMYRTYRTPDCNKAPYRP